MPKKEKPTGAWYLIPIFLGIIGGIIGYFAVKNDDKKMANKLLIIGFIMTFVAPIVLMFLVFGGIFISGSASQAEYEQLRKEKMEQCQKEITTIEQKFVSCASCNPSLYLQTSCVISNSLTVQDCKFLLNFTSKEHVDECLLGLAVKFKDVKFCDELGSGIYNYQSYSKSTCYLDVALASDKPSLCNGLNETEKISCLKSYSTRKELQKTCSDLEFLLREKCMLEKLMVDFSNFADSTKVCLGVFTEDAGYKSSLKINENRCTAIIAIGKKDLSLCDNSGTEKVSCYTILAKISDSVTLKDCDKLGADYLGCYSNVALRTADTSICIQMPDYNRYNCIQNIALQTNNISLCAQLQPVTGGGVDQKYCANIIYNRVKDNLTVSICDAGAKIQNLEWTEECYFTVAKKTLDISLCDKSGRYKDECRTIVSHAGG